MSAYANKYNIGLNGKGYVISQNKQGVRYYQKKKAPTFVNKYGGGDASYRDATFWQYFVQTNWRNGSKQLKFDDPGKFWKSANVDTTILEELKLSKAFLSAGQIAAGIKANVIEAWRADAAIQAFGTGADGALTISGNTTEAPIDSACTGTAGSTSLSATNASFASAQVVLIHQTRGTGAGLWEKRTIASYSAGTIVLTEPLTNSYVSGAQVRVLKQYSAVTINSGITYTAKAWDGTVGGILAFLCNGTVTVTGTITATGKGFRGGSHVASPNYAYQGEGTAGAGGISPANNGNGGGGGGPRASGGTGANGANGLIGLNGDAGDYRGAGGAATGSADLTTMVFGGGGGAGGNSTWGYTEDRGGSGGNGGGIIFIIGKTVSLTGAIQANGNNGQNAVGSDGAGGSAGAGGSILLRGQTLTLGTNLTTASGGASGGANGGGGGANGQAPGAVGRIHIDYSTTVTGTTTPTLDTKQDSTLVDIPASTTSTAYAGGSNGRIYSWDGGTTWTEVFDTRALTWFDTGTDTSFIIGDDAGTEKAIAQSFQIPTTTKVKGVRVYLKKVDGTPGDITVRIETNSSTVPSGTLADANATTTIPAFTTSTYGWITVDFPTNFNLSATTTYWLVLKTAAAANDNNYELAGKTATGYASGNNATSTNGGSSWTAGTSDAYFKILGNPTSVNCMLITKVGGLKKLYIGTGDPDGTENTDARLYSFDGSTWALTKTFATATESVISSLTEYSSNSTVYLGVGPQAKIYSTTDFSTFTVAKDVDVPQNPGYVYTMKEYNRVLHVGGGSPDSIPTQYYNGFLNIYDTTAWNILYPFDFTVIKSLEFYDAYLFMGTYHGHLYVYDTSSLNPLFNFKDQYGYQTSIHAMKYFDDKLYLALYPQAGTGDTNSGIWLFDRRGLTQAHTIDGVTGYRCFAVLNGSLLVGTGDDGYVYKLSADTYASSGWYQSSYFDANLPSIDKLYNAVTIRHDPLATGQSITVYYRFKESDSWTLLGLSNSVGAEEKVLSFPTGISSKKISLKVELATSNTSSSPKLTEVIMQYSLYPTRKFQWTLRLKAKQALRLLDGTLEPRTAEEIRQDLEDLFSEQQLYHYVDVDGTSYNVLVHDLDTDSWVINSGDVNEEQVAITLLEA